ncbi:hypothetical protein F4780DRAFT_307680 [Xylariomycetidae sp. FL0641]|nr:hypothetical protein F4780DRAFT_307680 [Xylariomycetidae sp. FL0641]
MRDQHNYAAAHPSSLLLVIILGLLRVLVVDLRLGTYYLGLLIADHPPLVLATCDGESAEDSSAIRRPLELSGRTSHMSVPFRKGLQPSKRNQTMVRLLA